MSTSRAEKHGHVKYTCFCPIENCNVPTNLSQVNNKNFMKICSAFGEMFKRTDNRPERHGEADGL